MNALVLATAMLALAGTAKQTVVLQCWVVEASYEEREAPHFDPGLEPIKQAVSDLTFNTYRKLKAQRAAMAVDETARLPINGRYTLFLTPVSREEDGRVRVDIRVEMKREDFEEPVNALSTRLVMMPGKQVKLGGLELNDGSLVIVLEAEGAAE